MLIKQANLHTMAGPVLEKQDIFIQNGKIAAIGQNLRAEEDDVVINARGLHAYPGFIDAHCHAGLAEEGMGAEGDDLNENANPITPALQALDGINPLDPVFSEALAAGVTACVVCPGSANVIAGQCCALKTAGSSVEEMLIKNPVALKAALGENPKREHGGQKHSPQTRMATAALFREAFAKARHYADKRSKNSGESADPGMEALLAVLRGELILKIHAHRADDMQTALRLVKELQIPRFSLEHATEAHLMAKQLRAEGVPVILGPVLVARPKIEMKNLSYGAAALLEQEGVPFALCTDYPVLPLQFLALQAGLLTRFGCSGEAALRAITVNAARFAGLEERLGTLEPGKDADILLFDADPLAIAARPLYTLVNGEIVYRRQPAE